MSIPRIGTLVPARRVAEIAGISPRRLRHWEGTDLVRPAVSRQLSPRNTVRLYSLDGVLAAVVAATLVGRPGISLQHLRKVLDRLESEGGYSSPLTQLVFAVEGPEIYFQHPNGEWEGSRATDQVVLWQVLSLEPLREQIRRRVSRDPSEVGAIRRTRRVMGFKAVFAGTRVPVETVVGYMDAGYSDGDILSALPNLQKRDLEAAREHRREAAG